MYVFYSYTYNGIALHKWVAIAKQALSELNLSTNFDYDPIWGVDNKPKSEEFVKKIISAKLTSEKNIELFSKKIHQQHQGWYLTTKSISVTKLLTF